MFPSTDDRGLSQTHLIEGLFGRCRQGEGQHPGTRTCREVTTPGLKGGGEGMASAELSKTKGAAAGAGTGAEEKCSLW